MIYSCGSSNPNRDHTVELLKSVFLDEECRRETSLSEGDDDDIVGGGGLGLYSTKYSSLSSGQASYCFTFICSCKMDFLLCASLFSIFDFWADFPLARWRIAPSYYIMAPVSWRQSLLTCNCLSHKHAGASYLQIAYHFIYYLLIP